LRVVVTLRYALLEVKKRKYSSFVNPENYRETTYVHKHILRGVGIENIFSGNLFENIFSKSIFENILSEDIFENIFSETIFFENIVSADGIDNEEAAEVVVPMEPHCNIIASYFCLNSFMG
jgi:hypothetical protein